MNIAQDEIIIMLYIQEFPQLCRGFWRCKPVTKIYFPVITVYQERAFQAR